MGFCGGGCDGFVGHVSPGCQGAPVWWYEGGGRIRSAAKEEEEEEEEEDGAKSGPEPNPPLPLSPLFLTQTQTPSNPFYQKSC